ncbi:hypothetical protein IW261DRAFT_1050807 [Armillaria novae-zelandiae]|uniref:Apple domain-containing protein n=1 Tax=Armillaria novae-zelandiae TaxID=153914 RepID=A0AA39PEH9_9AGAR|nr:hypothetical protein IW261DRAFT_1050807 [Armillaria novae-zelandiae]
MFSFSALLVIVATALMVRGQDNSTDPAVADSLTPASSYNAPVTPWEQDATPGWYFGDDPSNLPESFTDLPWLKDSYLCRILEQLNNGLNCPTTLPTPSSDGYHQTFSNLTGATQAGDYMTFGLVETVEACKAMCDNVNGCAFVNAYHDVNGKDGSPLLSCSLFTQCHSSSDAINRGGQSQPDGSIDFITNSDGYCKQRCWCPLN